MALTEFINGLLEQGSVKVAGELVQFSEEDKQQAIAPLRNYYNDDSYEMPHTAPAFDEEAALWAAEYVYSAIQLAMLRDLGEEAVQAQLKDFTGELRAEAVYSADLMLRYLPDLLELAKSLAPGDVLVKRIKETLHQWPFSSVGTELAEEADHKIIIDHPSLRSAYIDRIIKQKDTRRLKNNEQLMELAAAALGNYPAELWPELQSI